MTTNISNTTHDASSTPPAGFPRESNQAAFYKKRLPEIRAVKPDELAKINVDVHQAVTTILGALPEILAFRQEMAKLVHIDQSLIDGLGEYAEAAAEADSRYTIALQPKGDLGALYEEALRVRETFRLDTIALAHRGLIPEDNLKAFKGLVGYKNVAFEIINYANLLMSCWSTIEGKSALTVDEVLSAVELGRKLRLEAGYREQAPEVLAEANLIRHQAVTLLLRAYDEVRRALTYLRWREGDIETIAPSLYAGRGKRNASSEAPPAPAAAPPAPAVTPAAPAVAAPTPSLFTGVDDEPVEDGLPGGSPLQRQS